MNPSSFVEKFVKNGRILPNNIKVIKGGLYLNNNNITKIENLPSVIEGSLSLSNNNITKIENLPSVIRDLYLNNNNITYINPFCLCKQKNILLKYFSEKDLRKYIREMISCVEEKTS